VAEAAAVAAEVTTMYSLRSCPFCGSPARLGCTPHAGEEKARILVACGNVDCGATIEGRADEAAIVVVERWNRRVNQSS
jgi:hypothetical protein